MTDVIQFLASYHLLISHGLFYGLSAIGLAFSIRYLKVPDFTCLGSIVLGGISCIFVFNYLKSWGVAGSVVGILAGGASGLLLSLVTAALCRYVNISLEYAGILSYVSSVSLGFLITRPKSDIDIDPDRKTILTVGEGVTQYADIVVTLLLTFALGTLLHYLLRRRTGKLIMALTGTPTYRQLQHPCPHRSTTHVLIIGNFLTAISGALFATSNRVATVFGSHTVSFLLIAIGSIYIFRYVASLLARLADASLDAHRNPVGLLGNTKINLLTRVVSDRFSSRYEHSRCALSTFCGFSGIAVLLQVLYGVVADSPHLPKHFEYLATVAAVALVLFVGTRLSGDN